MTLELSGAIVDGRVFSPSAVNDVTFDKCNIFTSHLCWFKKKQSGLF